MDKEKALQALDVLHDTWCNETEGRLKDTEEMQEAVDYIREVLEAFVK